MLDRVALALALAGAALAFAAPAAAFCLNPDALGVSRVITVDTSHGLEVGRSQYPQTLALQPHEVVLTFDDGPNPVTTEAVLKALDDQCVKATFFVIGIRATLYPQLVLDEEAAGHTIGTHSQNHPLDLQTRPAEDGIREIDNGIASISRVLGHPPAPFFRFPGLGHTHALRAYLAGLQIGVFSIDAEGGDWMGFMTPDKIRARAVAQLKERDGGILLLHDALRNTATMLPDLLRDLKAQGFKIVQVVPAEYTGPAVAAVASHPVVIPVRTTSVVVAPAPNKLATPAVARTLPVAAAPAVATASRATVAAALSTAPLATAAPAVADPPRPPPYMAPVNYDN